MPHTSPMITSEIKRLQNKTINFIQKKTIFNDNYTTLL